MKSRVPGYAVVVLAIPILFCYVRNEVWVADRLVLKSRVVFTVQTQEKQDRANPNLTDRVEPYGSEGFGFRRAQEDEKSPVSPKNSTGIERNESSGIIYSRPRFDRSGSSIQDMLMAHAYAFHHNFTYGGACGPDKMKRKTTVQSLLKSMGLDKILLVTCPEKDGVPFIPPLSSNARSSPRMVPKREYFVNDTLIWTPEYISFLGKSMDLASLAKETPRNYGKKTIVVHIRRGDVTPCVDTMRYLPNSHYLTLIDKYSEKLRNETGHDPHVVVYSESNSYESMDVFRERGCEMRLDGALEGAWRGMIFEADVFIMSTSSFSLTPAVLRTAIGTTRRSELDSSGVVYTPYAHQPLAGWDVQDAVLTKQSRQEARKLRDKCEATTK